MRVFTTEPIDRDKEVATLLLIGHLQQVFDVDVDEWMNPGPYL